MPDGATYVPRLKTLYREKIRAEIKEEFGLKNDMMIPKLEK
ncbi:MAG: 50S ribosomal protein L5, partial [Pseudomonadota bacterium]